MKRKKKPNILKFTRKQRITLALAADLVERLRTVVYWTPKLTLAGVLEAAIARPLKKLEKGRRFRKRKGKLPVGRPRKHASSK
jgi:hypothetical protein